MFHYIDRPPSGVVVNDIETHSVQVSWEAVENANHYNVRLTQTMGDNQLGLCSEFHTVSVKTSSLSVVVGKINNEMLRAYTTYSITLVAMSDVWGSSGESEPISFTTDQTSEDYYSTACVNISLLSFLLSHYLSPLSLSIITTWSPHMYNKIV